MHDLSKLYSQNNLVVCKPSKRSGLKSKRTDAGLGFIVQGQLVEELEVLSPTTAEAKVPVQPGDSIFVRAAVLKDHGITYVLETDPPAAPAQEFILIPFEAIIFVLPR